VPQVFRGGFDSLVLLVSWEVWKERNRRTFDNVCSTPAQLVVAIRDEDLAWVAVGFRRLGVLLAAVQQQQSLARSSFFSNKIGLIS